MKCPNCGAHIEEGLLFCEVCGEEINIVPDYDPETDLSVDIDGVFDRTKEIDVEEVKKYKSPKKRHNDEYRGNKHISGRSHIDEDDFDDDEVGEISALKDTLFSIIDFWNKNIFTKIIVLFIVLLIAAACVAFGMFIKKISDRQSVDYLVEKAEESVKNKDYETAIDLYEKAIEKDPDNTKIKYAISNCYLSDGQDKNAVFILKEIALEHPELADDAYQKMFNIYSVKEDWKSINDILLDCQDPEVVAKYQEYLCKPPEFGSKPGEYDDILDLELKSGLNGFVYYTLDGSDPDETSTLYTEPIHLESGEFDVKAIYVSEYGVTSGIAEGEYIINVTIPLAPMVSIESGSYNVPILISVDSDINCDTYYVCYRANVKEEERVDPDMYATKYEYPLVMPMGPSEFRFISYNEDGIPSTVITRKYNVTITDATVSKEEGANIATVYRYTLGGLTDTDGHVATANGKFEYIIEDALNLKGTIYYVINEYYVDTSNGDKRTLTGLRYAVNTQDSNDYGTLEINAKGEYYVIKEKSINVNPEG
ncbi:MAG: chitobiase/beta-hexosaminidase C-terminal domain-containing protein [Lachnospiraceae bacterium]|nr:chitobiase/beta-hexosaminidase C-terminal domain-containing protein [Lachnospiraceae bacterium]